MGIAVKIASILCLLTVGRYVLAWAIFSRFKASERKIDDMLIAPMKKLFDIIFWGTGTTCALHYMGIDVSPLFAALGSAALGIAIAAKGVLQEIIACFVIVFTSRFDIGDTVTIKGNKGTVKSFGLTATTLETAAESRVVIPNSLACDGVIEYD